MKDIRLSTCQEKAAKAFMEFMGSDEDYFVLYSAPGCGKTFLTAHLMDLVRERYPAMSIHCTATTNKASAVLGSNMPDETLTIHKLLSLRLLNDFKTGKQFLSRDKKAQLVTNSLIVIDEISMADSALLDKIKTGTRNCKFLLVGDSNQLAPVEEDVSPAFHRGYSGYELKTVMRQDADSGILPLAAQLRLSVTERKFRPIQANGKDIIRVTGKEFQAMIDEEFTENTYLNQAKIICWRNDRVNSYNDYVRKLHTQSDTFYVGELVSTNDPIIADGVTWASTDTVMEVVDVEAGVRMGIHGYWYTLEKSDGNLVKGFQANSRQEVKAFLATAAQEAKQGGSWFNYFRYKEFFNDLRAVHACTAHKSQGSTYDKVFVDLADIGACHDADTVARMLYVAVTRAKKQVILYGELPAKYDYNDFPKP